MPCTNAHVFPIPISEEIAMQMNTRSQCLFLYVVLVFLFSFLIIMLSFAKYLHSMNTRQGRHVKWFNGM